MKKYSKSNQVDSSSNRIAKLFVLLSVAAVTVSAAFASDGKVYPGSMAKTISGLEPIPALNYGSVANPSTTRFLNVELPAIHDNIDYSIRSGWVDVVDRHPFYNVRIKLQTVHRDGSSVYGWWGPNKYSSGSGSNKQRLSVPGLYRKSFSHYYYSASIPPAYNGVRSTIISYKISEYNSSDTFKF